MTLKETLSGYLFLGGKRNRDLPLQQRVFNLLTLYTFLFTAFLIEPVNFFLALPWILHATLITFGIIALFSWYLSVRKNIQLINSYIFGFFIFQTVVWFFNGGSLGGTIFFHSLHLGFTVVLLRGWRRNSWLVLNLTNVIMLFILEYKIPTLITNYTSELDRLIDIVAAYTIVGLSYIVLFNVLVKNYEKERKEVKEQNKVLEELTLRDPLTGLYNRRYLMSRLKEEVQNHRRHNHPFSILIMDIDFFKKVNDTWGHLEGDRVLKDISVLLTNCLRISDILGRYGGEEFLAILPMTTKKPATQVAEKIRSFIEQNLFSPNGVAITLSIGVEEFQLQSIHDLIAAADKKLYRGKQIGRNKVISDSEESVN